MVVLGHGVGRAEERHPHHDRDSSNPRGDAGCPREHDAPAGAGVVGDGDSVVCGGSAGAGADSAEPAVVGARDRRRNRRLAVQYRLGSELRRVGDTIDGLKSVGELSLVGCQGVAVVDAGVVQAGYRRRWQWNAGADQAKHRGRDENCATRKREQKNGVHERLSGCWATSEPYIKVLRRTAFLWRSLNRKSEFRALTIPHLPPSLGACPCRISIQGGTLSLTGREGGDYKGYVLIADSDFTGQSPNCIVNGNADATVTGTIFAPYCDIEVDGGGKTTSLSAQIIGYTVKITGSQTVNLYYDPEVSAESDPKVGLMR